MLQHRQRRCGFQWADETVLGQRLLAQMADLLGIHNKATGMGVEGLIKAHRIKVGAEAAAGDIFLRCVEAADQSFWQGAIHQKASFPIAGMGLEAVRHQHGFVSGALQEPELLVEEQRVADHDVFFHINTEVCNRLLLDQPVPGVDRQQLRVVQLNCMDADAVGVQLEHFLQQVCAVGP